MLCRTPAAQPLQSADDRVLAEAVEREADQPGKRTDVGAMSVPLNRGFQGDEQFHTYGVGDCRGRLADGA